MRDAMREVARLQQPTELRPIEQQRLARSWQRSRDYGLSQSLCVEPIRLSRADLLHQTQQHEALLRHLNNSLPLFEQLQQGRRCRLLFADAQGTILFSTGDPYFGNKAQRLALASGASWHEQNMGTNAIGTALKEKTEVSILGQQHFLAANQAISCSASPVLSPCGELLGVIDISSERDEHSQDMLLTARLLALAVENALVVHQQETHWLLNLAADTSSLHQPWSAIIALNAEGELLGANRSARQWLTQLSIEPLFKRLQQGQLTTINQGIALLSRQTGSTTRAAQSAPALAIPTASSQETRALRLMARQIPLLIQGETGSGKDHLIKRLHKASQRAAGPLIAVNCGALPNELLEAELFGYVAGAFTGGHNKGRPGYIRAADRGVLFLDEIGELPLVAQTRLLRVLQEKTVTPVGCHVPQTVDFQLITASHQDLAAMVKLGTFRQDLYFRINGDTLTLPPLREYKQQDFNRLLSHLLAELTVELTAELASEEQPLSQITLDEAVLNKLRSYHWPGNIRQLKQVLEVATALADSQHIQLHHLPELAPLSREQISVQARKHTCGQTLEHTCEQTSEQPKARDLKSLADQQIVQALDECNGNVSAAARQLQMSRTTIYARLKALKSEQV